ncbi:cytoplasmic heat shock protein 70 [Histomonas meleagridis]|uniref:cytoplasmic heat shock protein 70 n=1 Tax=Histomonas meleagridis TaxID=135588 RepID=UPI003559711F|nr:cytoplasmic heat shock protein 70 [Histomonas meleagridis]KAH0797219.1 cytoplasmic heat shock protein 70 [Histomonas meleagridis]
MAAIGIDLGTTYSCAAISTNGNVEVFQNDNGRRTVPSFVTFTNTERFVGEQAKDQEVYNLGNAVFDVKRLIGRKFSDETVQNDMKKWPFKVVKGEDDHPMIEVQWMNQTRQFYPEEISAMVLGEVKRIAEKSLGTKVEYAVVTVPAYFTDSQRRSTITAAKAAGLEVLRIINEPTAAAITYGLKNKFEGTRHILVYDLGGGTFDASIVKIQDKEYTVVAKGGNTHLGGRDFDNCLFEKLADIFQKEKGCDLRNNQRSCCLLRNECEKLKINLSSNPSYTIRCPTLYQGIDFSYTATRAFFNDLIENLLQETIQTVKTVIHDAGLRKNQIDDVVLVGGSSRIPHVKELLTELFGKEPKRCVDPDESVAYGAAIQAEILRKGMISATNNNNNNDDNTHEEDEEDDNGIILLDVTSLSLGIDITHDRTAIVVPRNTPLPCNKMETFCTSTDYQTVANIKVLEGERLKVQDNNELGQFRISNLTPAPAGKTKVDVTFNIDENGTLVVTAQEQSTDNIVRHPVINVKGRLTDEQIQKIIEEAEKNRRQDEMIRRNIEAMNNFQSFINGINYRVRRMGQNDSQKVAEARNIIQQMRNWTDDNFGVDENVIEEKKREFERRITPLIDG